MAGEFGTMSNRRRSRWPAVVIGLLVFGIVVYGGYVLGLRRGEQAATTDTSVEVVEDPTTEPGDVAGEERLTWYAEPKSLTPAPSFFVDLAAFYGSDFPDRNNPEADLTYLVWTVGELDGKRILLAGLDTWTLDYRDHVPVVLLEEGAAQYRLLLRHSPDFAEYNDVSKYNGPALADGVTVDTETELSGEGYSALIRTSAGPVADVPLRANSDYPQLWSDIVAREDATLTEFERTTFGVLYRQRVSADTSASVASPTDLALERFVLRRRNGTAQVYQHHPEILADDYTIGVQWNDGTATAATYRLDGMSGCGSPDSITVWDGDVKQLQLVGAVSNGEKIYGFDSADPVLGYYYAATGGKTYVEGQEVSFTAEDYAKNRGVIAYQDGIGRVLVFANTYYGPNAECGKPVIYLYPRASTDVSVAVAAEITVSEPAYGTGWQVRAEPSGRLTMADGQTYDSLFWEGTGHGSYPPITQGFVVARADLESTLRDHLSQLGLNVKESSDFLEFWLPHMPATPYTRLTWLGTQQMDELAPLTVTPAPDTSIRVFLDFEGLHSPISIKPQRLSAPDRTGFTLIEWGGLLRR